MTRTLAFYSISIKEAMTDIVTRDDSTIKEAIEHWALNRFFSERPDEEVAQYHGTAVARATVVTTETRGPTFEVEVYDPTYD